jgi:bifunctional non-homologous end joining protein LigD
VDQVPVTLMAFDVLHAGTPVLERPIEERWKLLEHVTDPRIVVSPPTREHGDAVFAAVLEKGLEGIVAKKSGSRYRPGMRTDEWRKVVHRRSARFVVGGYLPGDGARSGSFASLLLGLWDGGRLRFAGAAGSGFDDASLGAIRTALDQMERSRSPFHFDGVIPRNAVWVEPSLVAMIEFREWTHDRHLRAPVFKGFTMEPLETVTLEAEGPDA